MPAEKWQYLDQHLRLRLADLDARRFEVFFLDFLSAGISLAISRNGSEVTKRIIRAETYAAGSGRDQKGIDLRAVVEGGEIWVFQCKSHKTWSVQKTLKAIQDAEQYQAHHYFLVVACDPHKDVQDEMEKYPNWTFWNLDKICSEFKNRVHPSQHVRVLSFLPPEELRRFVPFTTEALIPPDKLFERFLGGDKLFRHDWNLVGRDRELQRLRDFVAGPHKVQVLTAKGGDGKSRLLWGLCRALATGAPEKLILCLNHHRGQDDLSFAFTGNPTARLILVDDAHRTEQVPLQLLALVREDASTKIIFATRPQGVEALAHKLYEAGLASDGDLAPQLSLGSLKKADVKALAAEALGERLNEHSAALAALTADSPFLTVIAGELLRSGRLEWERWASHDEFRQHVFREFEQKNLETLPDPDREFARGLIRIVALLAPAAVDASFPGKLARLLGCSVFALETQLSRLRQSELVAGRDDGLRIVPDLFADFLVYDTCYGPKKMHGFVQQTLCEFSDRGAALLRNMSEATWVARANGVADDAFFKAVLESELVRFETSSFYQRAETLKHWAGFSIYLPAETLQLGRLALDLETAPKEQNEWLHLFGAADLDSHGYVLEQIPSALRPVAKYHDSHRNAALDLLWKLGLRTQQGVLGASDQNHPWAVLADVIKYEPRKPVRVAISALQWLEAFLHAPENLSALEQPSSILRILLGPCFDRLVEFTEWEGRTIRWWRREVSIENTQPIRDRALAILAWVIENGSWLAALDALSVLEAAVHRAAPLETKHVIDGEKFRADWRPERIKALALCEKAIARHDRVAVRYEIRNMLKRILAFEEDSVFAEQCRKVLSNVPDDLALQTAVAILSHATFEFRDTNGVPGTPVEHESAKELWNERIQVTATNLAATYPDANALFGFLNGLADEITRAGNHVSLALLYATLAGVSPGLAQGLANIVLATNGQPRLAGDWPALIENNSGIDEARRTELFAKAARSDIPCASVAVIRALAWRARGVQPLSDSEKALLIQIAQHAGANEAFHLLQLVAWSSDANLPWVFEILATLPLRDAGPDVLDQLLEALVPFQERKIKPSRATVRRVLEQLVTVRELDLYQHGREWDALIEEYPREVYDLVRKRILHASSGAAGTAYRPVPRGCHRTFHIPALADEPDYSNICNELWLRALDGDESERYYWVQLFQAVVFQSASLWQSRMLAEISTASSEEALLRLADLLRFEGSLIVLRFPEITRAFLTRALALHGEDFCEKLRVALYSACGPQVGSYSGGVLDKQLDYVEAEAERAATARASDEVLGPFYRWIVAVEQKKRLMQKVQAEAEIVSLD